MAKDTEQIKFSIIIPAWPAEGRPFGLDYIDRLAATFEATSGPDGNGCYSGIKTFYVNGEQVAGDSSASYKPMSSDPDLREDLTIGSMISQETLYFPFNGLIDNVLVFNRPLSASQVKYLYESTDEDDLTVVACDAAGNLTLDHRGYSYEYDHDNRLTKITKRGNGGVPDTVAEFTYDALGRRIESVDSVAETTTRYYYDGWRVLSQTDGSGVRQRHYVYGNTLDEALLLVHDDGNETNPTYTDYYYAHDHLYSPAALLDDAGAVVERYEYDAYGTCYVMEDDYDPRTSSSYNNPIAFTGQRLDNLDSGDLQLMYYKYRFYCPNMGRFLQRDPMEYFDGMHLYEYVSSQIVKKYDSLGLTTILDVDNIDDLTDEETEDALNKAALRSFEILIGGAFWPLAHSLFAHWLEGSEELVTLSDEDISRIRSAGIEDGYWQYLCQKQVCSLGGYHKYGDYWRLSSRSDVKFWRPKKRSDTSLNADLFYSFGTLHYDSILVGPISNTRDIQTGKRTMCGMRKLRIWDHYKFMPRQGEDFAAIPGDPDSADINFWVLQELGRPAPFWVIGTVHELFCVECDCCKPDGEELVDYWTHNITSITRTLDEIIK